MKNVKIDGRMIAELSTSDFPPATGFANLREARRRVDEFEVTDLNEEGQEELSMILDIAIATRIPGKAISKIIDKFMDGRERASTEEYLRLAAFTLAGEKIRKKARETEHVSDMAGINSMFLDDCIAALRKFTPTEDYDSSDMRGKVLILEQALEPILSGYDARIPSGGYITAV